MSQDKLNSAYQVAWVGVDWGTTSLRLWCMDKANKVVWATETSQGMSSLSSPDQFEQVLLEHLGPCLSISGFSTDNVVTNACLPVVCCGMVGARQGWMDAGYQSLPWYINQPAMLLPVTATDKRLDVYIVQGLAQYAPADVMRGEETQLLGLIPHLAQSHGVICLPGTHSKWALFDKNKITAFSTFITGELYALLSTHSLLKHSIQVSMPTDYQTVLYRQSFMRGVEAAMASPTQVITRMFAIRAEDVLDKANLTDSGAYLSGLLIGQELVSTQDLWRQQVKLGQPVHVVGAGPLMHLYQWALEEQGVSCISHAATTMVLAGLARLYKQISSN